MNSTWIVLQSTHTSNSTSGWAVAAITIFAVYVGVRMWLYRQKVKSITEEPGKQRSLGIFPALKRPTPSQRYQQRRKLHKGATSPKPQ